MRRFLERQGFECLRVRGSHHFYARDELRTTSRFTETAHGRSPGPLPARQTEQGEGGGYGKLQVPSFGDS